MWLADPEDEEAEAKAGLPCAGRGGDIFMAVQGPGGVDFEDSNFDWGPRRLAGAPWIVYPKIRKFVQEHLLPEY